MKNERILDEMKRELEIKGASTNWEEVVNEYAEELLENLDDAENLEDAYKNGYFVFELLNGADSWTEYSWNGNSLIYDDDISERFGDELLEECEGEALLDLQAAALEEVADLLSEIFETVCEELERAAA